MNQLVINGDQTIIVSAQDTAIILDSLAVQPYNRVANLIQRITMQLRDTTKPAEVPADDVPKD